MGGIITGFVVSGESGVSTDRHDFRGHRNVEHVSRRSRKWKRRQLGRRISEYNVEIQGVLNVDYRHSKASEFPPGRQIPLVTKCAL